MYLDKEFFFEMMSTTLSKAGDVELSRYITLLQDNYEEVLRRSEEGFLKLVLLLDPEEMIVFAKRLLKYPEVQYRLFKMIDSDGQKDKLTGEIAERYFSLICDYEPKKVIDYLENNIYNIDRILDICKAKRVKRGYGYLKYKIGQIHETMEVYREIIKEMWDDEEGEDDPIEEVVDEIISFNMDISLYKQNLIKLLGFVSSLFERQKLKKRIIKKLFETLFSFSIENFLTEVETAKQYDKFMQDKVLSSFLLLNFKNVVELNNSIMNILKRTNYQIKSACYGIESHGTVLHASNCYICKGFRRREDIGLNYHSCKTAFHDSCGLNQELTESECPKCIGKGEGNLISECCCAKAGQCRCGRRANQEDDHCVQFQAKKHYD